MYHSQDRQYHLVFALMASTLIATSLSRFTLGGSDVGGGNRDDERAITLTLRSLGGDRSEDPPAYQQLQPIRLEYTLKLGKFAGLDHILYFESTELTDPGVIKVTKDGVEVPATLHSSSDLVNMIRSLSKIPRLEPGESISGIFVVNLSHDMTAEGTYTIEMTGYYHDNNIENATKVKAKPIVVRVKRHPL